MHTETLDPEHQRVRPNMKDDKQQEEAKKERERELVVSKANSLLYTKRPVISKSRCLGIRRTLALIRTISQLTHYSPEL